MPPCLSVYENPLDSLQAKFSLNFAVAVAIVDGKAGLKQFTAERLHDPKVKRLMKRVELVRPATHGKERMRSASIAEIEIAMINGAVHRGRDYRSPAAIRSPPSRAEIEDKLAPMCRWYFSAASNCEFFKRLLDVGTRPIDCRLARPAPSVTALTFSWAGRDR